MEAVYTYDAVKVYALSVDKILKRQGDICNGTEVVETIINMGSYPSDIQGINVSIYNSFIIWNEKLINTQFTHRWP